MEQLFIKMGRHVKDLLLAMFEKVANGLVWRCDRLYNRLYDRVLYGLTTWRRGPLRNTVFVGVTGSAGKTTTKDLIAGILDRHMAGGSKNSGSLNWPRDMARVILGTRASAPFCVVEISGHAPGVMDLPLQLVQPTVGVVTSIGADHFTSYKSRDAIAQEKGKLISALRAEGIAILNADDPRVLAMQAHCLGRTVTYGLAPDALLRGDAVHSRWPQRMGLDVHWQGQSVHVQTQLCGAHWAPSVLAAVATGVALGVPLSVAAEALAGVEPYEGRMAPVWHDGIAFIRDDWKAPLSSIEPAFEFMRDACASRKIIVVGTISDYQGDSTRRYVEVGKMALDVADCVVFVGPRASACLRAKHDSSKELLAFASLRDASTHLKAYLKPGDLVLLKGSHKADHMQRLLIALTGTLQCWRADCGRVQSCETCELLHVPSGPALTKEMALPLKLHHAVESEASEISVSDAITHVVIGLGNPAKDLANTPHNVGYRALEVLAQRMSARWVADSLPALVARGEFQGLAICLIKPLAPMNEIGPVLLRLAHDFAFTTSQCVLVHDDLDLPLGVVRARLRGGDGGHLGVRSILQSFQDDKFRRVKMGVAPAQSVELTASYVLSPFGAEQQGVVASASEVAADRVLELLR
ncbi:MAG: hypothetical protein H7293_00680 [Candidatus Saccharibacteria bacterium]|nr:hypothetical protein [Rhodoferax sp.]